jgi:hypothetical protein
MQEAWFKLEEEMKKENTILLRFKSCLLVTSKTSIKGVLRSKRVDS